MAPPAENNDWLCTQTRGDCIDFQWTIKKFHQLPEKNGQMIWSPVFPDNSTEQWKVGINPQGDRVEDVGWISAYLTPVTDKLLGINIKCQLIISQFNKALQTIQFDHKFQELKGRGCPKFLERSKLSVQDDTTDTITIHCKIEVLGTYITSSFKTKIPKTVVPFAARKNRISRNFKSLYKNPMLTDFTVVSGIKKFRTHKIVLASRSPVFAAMFKHKVMKENVTNQLNIKNIKPAVVAGLLEFIYTDNVSKIGELAQELLAAADQYELEDLKSLCEESLYKTLDEDNAAELLALADLHKAHQLKEYVMQFIAAHPENVVKSAAFKSMKLPEALSKELICALVTPASANVAK